MRWLLFMLLAGCSDGSDPGGPHISDIRYVGQFPADKFTVIFVFDFKAANGVSAGTANFYVKGQKGSDPLVTKKMSELLLASDQKPTATEASFVGVTLRFPEDTTASDATVYLQIVDNKDLKSNLAYVSLHLDWTQPEP